MNNSDILTFTYTTVCLLNIEMFKHQRLSHRVQNMFVYVFQEDALFF